MGNRIFPLNTSWQEGLTISHQYIRRAVIYLSFWPCHRKPDRQKTYLPPHITPIKTVLPNWHWWLSLLLGEAAVYFKLQVSDSQTFLFKDKGERCFAVTCHLGKQTKEYKFKSWMPMVEELQVGTHREFSRVWNQIHGRVRTVLRTMSVFNNSYWNQHTYCDWRMKTRGMSAELNPWDPGWATEE